MSTALKVASGMLRCVDMCHTFWEMMEIEEQWFDEVTGVLRKTQACSVVKCQ